MKKHLTIYQGLFLVLLAYSLNHPEKRVSWFFIFLPLLLELVDIGVTRLLLYYKIDDKLRFWLFKRSATKNIRKAAKKARDIMNSAKPQGNPGQFQDPLKNGKR